MTENMAGRGEGLAGLVAKWRKFVRCVMENEVVAPVGDDFAYCDAMRHCANELEAEIDAAAPAGTPEQLHEVWASKILKEYGIYAIPQALADFQAALATPSPQAPQQESSFSTTSAREQSSATAPGKCSVGDEVTWTGQEGKRYRERIRRITEPQPGNYVFWVGKDEFPVNHQQVELVPRPSSVPVGEQKQEEGV